MNNKANYKTKQKEQMIDFFAEHEHEHVNAREVYDSLKERGIRIGLTTVYRHLEQLTREGMLVKSVVDENTPACFEFTGHHVHENHSCYHCKCIKCGKLIHLNCDEITKLEKHISSEHGFLIQPQRTVFFGLCENCQNA